MDYDGPLSLSAEADMAIVRTGPTITLIKIRFRMLCPKLKIDNVLPWLFDQVLRAFISGWASGGGLHTSECQVPIVKDNILTMSMDYTTFY